MSIIHKMFFDGKVQSLRYTKDGVDKSMGVMEPGEYDFGTAGDTGETMIVVDGEITINGKAYAMGQSCVIKAGERILMRVDGVPATYNCIFKA